MTTFDTSDALIVAPKPAGLFTRIVRAVEAYRARRAQRRVLLHLSQYDAHMLRDMGLDPRDIEDALNARSLSLLFHPLRQTDTR
jgi:uncharacterized protein YjiS (DUF1127 family)